MYKIADERKITRFILLFSVTYMIAYILRGNYGTVILEMEKSTDLSKEILSMALTGSAIAYGVGQLCSGFFGDIVSPKKLVTFGMLLTSLMNVLLPFCKSPYLMIAVWSINGLAQAFLWPPMVRIMTCIFDMETYKKHVVKVSWGGSIGTILLYLVCPVFIAVWNWKYVFFVSALLGVGMAWIWNKYCCEIANASMYSINTSKQSINTSKQSINASKQSMNASKHRVNDSKQDENYYDSSVGERNKPVNKENVKTTGKGKKTDTKNSTDALFTSLFYGILLAIIFQGMLRDGVTTWMPTYISETYQLSSAVSILTGVILPIFSILCCNLATKIYRTYFKNPLSCAGIIFATGAVGAGMLSLMTGQSTVLSILLTALIVGTMHGVNLMLISMLPPFFEKQGKVSLVSGILNSCTYVGSAVSTYSIAVLAERYSWGVTVFAWFVIAVAGSLMCFICIKPWKKWEMRS